MNAKGRVCVCALFLTCCAATSTAHGQAVSSADGSMTISATVDGDNLTGLVTVDGSPDVTVSIGPSGISIGNLGVSVADLGSDGTNRTLIVSVSAGAGTVSGSMVLNEANELVSVDPAVIEALASLANTQAGQTLLTAAQGIEACASEATLAEALAPPPGDQLDGWLQCGSALLNSIAGGAAMVGGCGTPGCGTAYTWCCTSGATWYVSSLYGVATSCRYATF